MDQVGVEISQLRLLRILLSELNLIVYYFPEVRLHQQNPSLLKNCLQFIMLDHISVVKLPISQLAGTLDFLCVEVIAATNVLEYSIAHWHRPLYQGIHQLFVSVELQI